MASTYVNANGDTVSARISESAAIVARRISRQLDLHVGEFEYHRASGVAELAGALSFDLYPYSFPKRAAFLAACGIGQDGDYLTRRGR